MNVFEHPKYQEDVKYVAKLQLPWEKMQDTVLLLTGATGMIGSCMIDAIMEKNKSGLNCKIFALSRDLQKAKERFEYCWDSEHFCFLSCDINQPMDDKITDNVDFVLHLASNTHPVAYATRPVETIMTNILGTHHLLQFAVDHGAKRAAFASSNEVYGENRGDTEFFDELYCGYIDANTMRAGYPESKRCGEALCQAYRRQYGLDIVIPRFTRTYGPTMLYSDTKAISQFIKSGVDGRDVVLKSHGTQYFSYTYVADAVAGLFTILLCGTDGEAYNIADEASDIMLKELASIIAEYAHTDVVFDMADEVEQAGYSKATKARLDNAKLKSMGWTARYGIRDGLMRTMEILTECR